MNKTPISILTELCTQKKVNKPVFDEIDPNSLGPETVNSTYKFYIKCTAFGKSSIAGGVTKKGAKHTASEILLRKIDKSYDSDEDDDEPNHFFSTDYVSELLNLCVQKNFHKPDFILTEDFGPTHQPTFTYECRLDSIVRSGSASNKQQAKKLAAKNVLDILKQSYPDQEKKVMLVNDENLAKEESRRKITSYLEMKKLNKTGKMGTYLSERHNFFLDYKDDEFIESLISVLKSQLEFNEKYEKFMDVLGSQWEYKLVPFYDTNMMMFDLMIDFDQFTVTLTAKKEDMPKTIINYFMYMLHLTPVSENPVQNVTIPDEVILYTF